MEQLTYSNPRMSAEIPNWPGGRNKRVIARFEIEQDAKRGERAVRTTDGAPKKLTYAKLARIVDGSDGRTYLAMFTEYGSISIMKGDMKFQQEWIGMDKNNPRYAQALELFAVEQACTHCNGFHADPNDHCIPSYPKSEKFEIMNDMGENHGEYETLDEARSAAAFDRLGDYTIYQSGRIIETHNK